MSFTKKIAEMWNNIITRPAPAAQAPFSYGVVIKDDAEFGTRCTTLAAEVIGILKSAGHTTPAESVSVDTLSSIDSHRGVRFDATAAQAQAVANALPSYIVIRSDCRVLCPQNTGRKAPRCEID